MIYRRAFFPLLVMSLLSVSCSSPGAPQGTSTPITTEPDGSIPIENDGPCIEDSDCPFGERCIEGMCLEDPGADDLSGCSEDTDCPDGMICSEETGACIDPSTSPEVTTEEVSDCVDGQTRPCGIKIGECDYGVETCSDGVWSECVGAIGPIDELCNGLDDNCDGVVETTELDLDGDGFRTCEGDCRDDDDEIYPDAPEGCDGKDNDCDEVVDEAGDSYCDDGLYCNGSESCVEGACAPALAPDCSGLNDQCLVGTCDEEADVCVAQPLPDGGSCDDGDLCSIGSMCVHGECGMGSPVDCSGLTDSCNTGMCNALSGLCEPQPASDGTVCDDGSFCSVADACVAGVCTAGEDRDCSALNDSCNEGVCLESTQSCESRALADNTVCDDGRFCTVGDSCTAGFCGGSNRDCSASGGSCVTGVCNEQAGACIGDPVADGTACDDGVFCTSGDQCVAGSCAAGGPLDCSAVTGGDTCYDGLCDESMASCIAVDNNTCDACLTGSPTAVAGANSEVIPNTWVYLLGTDSSDPDGQSLTYSWSIDEKPDGSSTALIGATTSSPSMLADVAGDYLICLTVTDSESCPSEPDCLTLTVKPQVSLHLELTWDTTSSDLDLHYRAPGGTFYDSYPSCGSTSSDVYWCSSNPDWGSGGLGVPDGISANDPVLDVDNVIGYGPENINQDMLLNSALMQTVGVHYWLDSGGGITNARVRIYVDGELELEAVQAMSGPQFWEVADIYVSNDGTDVQITPLSGFIYDLYTPSGY
ncbi:MAG: hypothetical protein HOI23_00390 [Deltaproteobacteria bacterium]|jgi:hypothetical protein|nr:hypothetical protein [Deltaproteobacteria bacterium]MBT6434852.1 hypothetical protein [Deltaproteobacteria bacterium]MBT6488774.1 hypothetical protein [Deltaproteobacteria bacterium]